MKNSKMVDFTNDYHHNKIGQAHCHPVKAKMLGSHNNSTITSVFCVQSWLSSQWTFAKMIIYFLSNSHILTINYYFLRKKKTQPIVEVKVWLDDGMETALNCFKEKRQKCKISKMYMPFETTMTAWWLGG